MFDVGVRNMANKTVTKTNKAKTKIYRILSSDRILGARAYSILFEKIRKNIALTDDRFELLYMPLLNAFALYVQTLRDYSKKNNPNFINVGLERSIYITSEYLKNHGEDVDFRYIYAIFTAALLVDVGKIDFRKKIHICTQSGTFVREWQPVLGDYLPDLGTFYKIRDSVEECEQMSNLITPILAKIIIPQLGLICLREEPQLFAWFLAVLCGDDRGKDSFTNEMRILNQNFIKQFEKNRILHDIEEDVIYSDELNAGEEFWKWLEKKIQKDKINKKGSGLYKVQSGVLIDIEVFAQEFSSIYSDSFPSWTVVMQQFNNLGIAKLSGGDYKYEQFFGSKVDYKSKPVGMFSQNTVEGSKLKKSNEFMVIETGRGLINTSGIKNSTNFVDKKSEVSQLLERAETVLLISGAAVSSLDNSNGQ